jgi:Rrf2 family iron-sulfur cluster assembly transcriptional regulator
MMLTTKGRYAVMAMVDLAHYGINGKIIALHEIASRQDITLSYLEQLFNKLKKHDLVKAVKGPGGGYFLNKSPKDISILSVIDAVGEAIKITRCLAETGKGCIIKKSEICFTHVLWDGLGKQISGYLDSITLEDVCRGIK